MMMPQPSRPPPPPPDGELVNNPPPPPPPPPSSGGEMPPPPPPPTRQEGFFSPRPPMNMMDAFDQREPKMPLSPPPRLRDSDPMPKGFSLPGFSLVTDPGAQVAAEIVLILILAVLGVCINAVIMGMIVSRRKLRQQHNIFIFNIALSDFVTALATVMVITGPSTLTHLAFNLIVSGSLESCVSVLAVAVYRYISICLDPFGSRGLLTTLRCVLVCLISWLVIVAPNIFLVYRLFASNSGRRVLDIVMYVVSVLSLVITGVCYWLVYRGISGKKDGVTRERVEENKKVLRTFSLVYTFTVLSWLGPLAGFSYHFFSDERVDSIFLPLMVTTFASLNLNAILNPVVYVWRLKDFHMALFRHTCYKKFPCRRRAEVHSMQVAAVTKSSVIRASVRNCSDVFENNVVPSVEII